MSARVPFRSSSALVARCRDALSKGVDTPSPLCLSPLCLLVTMFVALDLSVPTWLQCVRSKESKPCWAVCLLFLQCATRARRETTCGRKGDIRLWTASECRYHFQTPPQLPRCGSTLVMSWGRCIYIRVKLSVALVVLFIILAPKVTDM